MEAPDRAERPVVMSRVLRNGEQDDGSFDLEFWRRAGAEAIWDAAQEMVCEQEAFRGGCAKPPPMDRTVLVIVRRGGVDHSEQPAD